MSMTIGAHKKEDINIKHLDEYKRCVLLLLLSKKKFIIFLTKIDSH